MEKLKEVQIDKLSLEEVEAHKNNVLALNDEKSIVEYLTFAVDTFYKTVEDGQNLECVDKFFKTEEFRPYYEIISNTEKTEE